MDLEATEEGTPEKSSDEEPQLQRPSAIAHERRSTTWGEVGVHKSINEVPPKLRLSASAHARRSKPWAKQGTGIPENSSIEEPHLAGLSRKPHGHARPMTWGEASQFDVLFSEINGDQEEEESVQVPEAEVMQDEKGLNRASLRLQLLRRRHSVKTLERKKTLWNRVNSRGDPYHDYLESHHEEVGLEEISMLKIPALSECKLRLRNDVADEHRSRARTIRRSFVETILNYLAALYIYVANTAGVESLLVTANAAGATLLYCYFTEDFAVKLDFAFLSVAVVFPLTFLISATFNRRELALSRLAEFKACILSTVLFMLTVDWPASKDEATKGRLKLPATFNAIVVTDFQEVVQLVYEYLSMPNVGHARNVVIWSKQKGVKKVRAVQNDIMKRLNGVIFDLSMHTEMLRNHGFGSSEASRLHQYHQQLQQRMELLRVLKYYRTPLATRSFGRAYIFFLPWLMGPYFAWVFEETGLAFAIILSCFTTLILLGLLNTQLTLEDPFIVIPRSWTPGIDDVKLDFEMAATLQTIEQYFVFAELHRSWALQNCEEAGNTEK